MIASVRRLLALLLLLALPLQGYAAGTMLLCGPLHQGPATAQSAVVEQVKAGSAGQDHSMHRAMAQNDANDSAATSDSPGSKVYGKCSLCAACSAVVAPPSVVLLFASEPAPTHYAVAAPQEPAGFLTGGIDRPPRPVLA